MDILKKVLLIKIISYILLCAFLFTNTAYSAQPIFTLRSHLISTGEGKDGELGERSAAYIFGNPPKFRMGSMELGDMKLLQALTLATQGKFDEAFIRTKGALLDEAYILNIDTAIFILSGLLAIYGPKTNKGKEVTTLLNIIKVHDKDVDQTVMKEKIQGHIVDSYLDEIRFLYERGYSLLQDNKAQEAWKLLNRAQSMLYELQSKYSFLKTDERIAPLRLDIEADLRMIQDGDELLLKDRLLQAVNPDTGEFLDIDLDFYEAHDGGKYHCNSQVLILDPEGRILTPVRTRRQRKKDISATAHLFKDESFEACALRAVKADTGLSSINKNSLIPLGPIIGEKKMGYQNYKDTRPYYYDEDGIFRSASQEKDNREYGRFFLCILTPEQVSEIQDTGNPLIQTLGLTFTSLSAYLESVVRQPEEFASTALQLFGHPNNINLVHSKILNGIESIFDHIKTHPDEIVELSYVETLYRSCRSTIERIENWEGSSWAAHLDSSDADFTDKCKAMALQDLENRYQELRTITVWRTLESHYRDKLILGWKDVYDIINVMNLLGNDAQSVQGRALLHTFLKKGVKIKRLSKSKFIFEYDGHRLKGLSIDNKGKLNITPAIR